MAAGTFMTTVAPSKKREIQTTGCYQERAQARNIRGGNYESIQQEETYLPPGIMINASSMAAKITS